MIKCKTGHEAGHAITLQSVVVRIVLAMTFAFNHISGASRVSCLAASNPSDSWVILKTIKSNVLLAASWLSLVVPGSVAQNQPITKLPPMNVGTVLSISTTGNLAVDPYQPIWCASVALWISRPN